MHKAMFLDRDGVINVEKNYVHRIEDFEFVDGIFDLCRRAQELGFKVVVITNQAGIARGYYTVAEYDRLTNCMLEQFAARGVYVGRVYYCPYHPNAGTGDYRRSSFDRKPNPGMILRAQEELGLDLSASLLVGDKKSDIEAGEAAGVKYNLMLAHEGTVKAPGCGRMRFSSLRAIEDWLGRTFG